jgi:co-chaperonin GroES (HSP10)
MQILGNRILIGPLNKPAVTKGGIHLIPSSHRPWVDGDDELQYRVLSVGTGRYCRGCRIPPAVREGDRVLCYLKEGGIVHTFDDGSHRMIVEADKVQMVF